MSYEVRDEMRAAAGAAACREAALAALAATLDADCIAESYTSGRSGCAALQRAAAVNLGSASRAAHAQDKDDSAFSHVRPRSATFGHVRPRSATANTPSPALHRQPAC